MGLVDEGSANKVGRLLLRAALSSGGLRVLLGGLPRCLLALVHAPRPLLLLHNPLVPPRAQDMTSLLDEARMAEDEREMVVAEEGEGGGEEEGAVDEKGTGAASAGAGTEGEGGEEGEGSTGAGGEKRGVEDGGGDWEGSKRARNE